MSQSLITGTVQDYHMNIVTLDCRGLACPQPVIQTKEALEQGAERIKVLVDNEASKDNITRFARSRSCAVEVHTLEQGCFQLILSAGGSSTAQSFDPADYTCPVSPGKGLVYVISSDSMGRGSDELGWALLQTYLRTIAEVKPLPAKILFYNGGVKLVTEGSGALDALQQLQADGVEILVCGTCLDFFQLKSAIQVGHISNMYEIMTAMSEADKVVSPL